MNAQPILLIDDSDDIRDVFSMWMEMEGFAIKTAASAVEALQLLREGLVPLVIFVDMNMPKLSGAEFVAKLKAEGLAPARPIYIFSANPGENVPGATGWIKKPVDMDEVLGILNKLKSS